MECKKELVENKELIDMTKDIIKDLERLDDKYTTYLEQCTVATSEKDIKLLDESISFFKEQLFACIHKFLIISKEIKSYENDIHSYSKLLVSSRTKLWNNLKETLPTEEEMELCFANTDDKIEIFRTLLNWNIEFVNIMLIYYRNSIGLEDKKECV